MDEQPIAIDEEEEEEWDHDEEESEYEPCFWCNDSGYSPDRTECDQCDYWEGACGACGAAEGNCDCIEEGLYL